MFWGGEPTPKMAVAGMGTIRLFDEFETMDTVNVANGDGDEGGPAPPGRFAPKRLVLRGLRVEGVAKAVAEEIEGEEGGGKKEGWEEEEGPADFHAVGTFLDEAAP